MASVLRSSDVVSEAEAFREDGAFPNRVVHEASEKAYSYQEQHSLREV
jgi:hypothetical protein